MKHETEKKAKVKYEEEPEEKEADHRKKTVYLTCHFILCLILKRTKDIKAISSLMKLLFKIVYFDEKQLTSFSLIPCTCNDKGLGAEKLKIDGTPVFGLAGGIRLKLNCGGCCYSAS